MQAIAGIIKFNYKKKYSCKCKIIKRVNQESVKSIIPQKLNTHTHKENLVWKITQRKIFLHKKLHQKVELSNINTTPFASCKRLKNNVIPILHSNFDWCTQELAMSEVNRLIDYVADECADESCVIISHSTGGLYTTPGVTSGIGQFYGTVGSDPGSGRPGAGHAAGGAPGCTLAETGRYTVEIADQGRA